MKNRNLVALAVLCLGFALIGCASRGSDMRHKTITGIRAVYLSEPYSVTFLVAGSDGALRPVQYHDYGVTVVFKEDVPAGNGLWADIITCADGGGGTATVVEAHIHSVDDVQGGGWNHGKFGSGQTQRVQ